MPPNDAVAIFEGQVPQPPRQHPALNVVGGLRQLDIDILDDGVDEGLGEDGGTQEEQTSTIKVDMLSAPHTIFCATISKVRIMILDGLKSLCTSCYMLYIFRTGAGWHQHIDQHIQERLHAIPRDKCYICDKMLIQLRLASVCYICNTVR